MPYITADDRRKFHLHADHGASGLKLVAATAGELQYCIAILIKAYLKRIGSYRYQDLNDIMGALAGAELEFYRRVVAPYEDKKIYDHGDVYDKS